MFFVCFFFCWEKERQNIRGGAISKPKIFVTHKSLAKIEFSARNMQLMNFFNIVLTQPKTFSNRFFALKAKQAEANPIMKHKNKNPSSTLHTYIESKLQFVFGFHKANRPFGFLVLKFKWRCETNKIRRDSSFCFAFVAFFSGFKNVFFLIHFEKIA